MADAKLLRELTIKSNVVKRLIKEVQSYEKEAEKDRERLKKMEAADPDDYNIKKAKEQLQVGCFQLRNGYDLLSTYDS